jgi:hypothetical protein
VGEQNETRLCQRRLNQQRLRGGEHTQAPAIKSVQDGASLCDREAAVKEPASDPPLVQRVADARRRAARRRDYCCGPSGVFAHAPDAFHSLMLVSNPCGTERQRSRHDQGIAHAFEHDAAQQHAHEIRTDRRSDENNRHTGHLELEPVKEQACEHY